MNRQPPEQVRLRDLPNIGPASERMLAAAGIETPEELDRLGSVEAYRRVLGAGCPPTLNLLYALDATLLGLDWRDLPLDRKEQLRRELTSGGR